MLSPEELYQLIKAKGVDDMDWRKSIDKMNSSVGSTYDRSVDALLDRLGLERKHDTMDIVLPALGIFGAGIAVGAALGVLFAPKRGDEIRSDIRHQLDDLKKAGAESYDQLKHKGEEAIGKAREKSPEEDKAAQAKKA
jgi:hypothetical protein